MGTAIQYLYVFLCSMVPVIELRGSIVMGAGMDLPMIPTFLLSVIGNMIPVPFILLFVRHFIRWMHKISWLNGFATWLENKAAHNTGKILKYASLGLILFVGIPLPGTGAWTGSLVAAFMDMRMRYALPSIFAGVVMAGVIMSGVSYGFFTFLSFLA